MHKHSSVCLTLNHVAVYTKNVFFFFFCLEQIYICVSSVRWIKVLYRLQLYRWQLDLFQFLEDGLGLALLQF